MWVRHRESQGQLRLGSSSSLPLGREMQVYSLSWESPFPSPRVLRSRTAWAAAKSQSASRALLHLGTLLGVL